MKKKILLIDDEVSLTKLMKLNLERIGEFEVMTENSGLLAVDAVRKFQPDLIFLDIMMPDMSGDDIAQKLRQDDALAAIPIVFLTAIVSREDTDSMGSYIGGNRFLAKPVKTEELLQMITDTIG